MKEEKAIHYLYGISVVLGVLVVVLSVANIKLHKKIKELEAKNKTP